MNRKKANMSGLFTCACGEVMENTPIKRSKHRKEKKDNKEDLVKCTPPRTRGRRPKTAYLNFS